jgi:hypothetical protein
MKRTERRRQMHPDSNAIQIRLLGPEDSTELTRLVELDTADSPSLPVLGGIVDGRLVAAHSLATDQSIADPFLPTAEVRSLLARRVRQLRGSNHGGGLLGHLRRWLGSKGGAPVRARASSPPGPADRMYLLPPERC